MKYFILILTVFICLVPDLISQELYSETEVIKFELIFSQPDYWKQLQDNRKEAIDIPATLIVNDEETFDSVGVRYKGNSSYLSVHGKKKSFNISMDEFIDGQDLWGYETHNLNNCFVDPTFVREKIAYDLYREHMNAGEVGYVALYINGEYWGLYANVEQVNKDFLGRRFSSRNGNLYKGDPDGGLIPLRPEPEYYKPYYEKKTNEEEDDWSDLIDLISVINYSKNLDNELPDVLDTDGTLWYFAISNLIINLDSYIYSRHNYYIYNNPMDKRFYFIPWDLNESFGCFPPQLSVSELKNYTIEPAPGLSNAIAVLFEKMYNVPEFKAIYLAHYRTVFNSFFFEDTVGAIAERHQALIDTYVQNDTKKLYSYDFFKGNVDSTVLLDQRYAPGLKELVRDRREYLLHNNELMLPAPAILNVDCLTENPVSDDDISFSAYVEADGGINEVLLFYRINDGRFAEATMYDDGRHDDSDSSDGIYGCTFAIPSGSSGNDLKYYVRAEGGNGQMKFEPEGAEHDYYTVKISGGETTGLVINEFMAGNKTTLSDPQGDYDDWIELYNNTNEEINLQGIYLTDDPADIKKWQFPDISISAGGYLLIWADEDTDDEGIHADIKLSKSGEYIGLYDTDENDNNIIDAYTFGEQNDDVSEGRYPNGTGNFTIMSTATPGEENINPVHVSEGCHENSILSVNTFPNPFSEMVKIECSSKLSGQISVAIHNQLGAAIVQYDDYMPAGAKTFYFRGDNLATGIYYYHIDFNGSVYSGELFLSK